MSQVKAFSVFTAATTNSGVKVLRSASFARVWLLTSSALAAIIFLWTTPYMGLASFAYFLMVGGLLQRKKPESHMKFMGSAMILDLIIVLTLEFQRSAIGTAIGMKLSPLQQAHIFTSTIAVVLYFPVVYLGWKSYWRKQDSRPMNRKWHVIFGVGAFLFRTAGFVLMFSLLNHVLSSN